MVERREHVQSAKHLTRLDALRIFDSQSASDLDWIHGAPRLQRLNVISGKPLTDFSTLREHQGLTDVWVQGGGVAEGLDILGELPNVQDVLICLADSVRSIDFLSSMPDLQRLRLLGLSLIDNLDPIRTLTELTYLDLHECVVDPAPIVLQCQRLTGLSLSGGSLRRGLHSIEPMLSRLNSFGVSDGPVSDPALLSRLQQANWVDLSRTDVVDLRPIAELPKLRTINLYGCKPALDLTPLAGLPRSVTIRLERRQEVRGLEAVRTRHRITRF